METQHNEQLATGRKFRPHTQILKSIVIPFVVCWRKTAYADFGA